jgi:hypothetical protein
MTGHGYDLVGDIHGHADALHRLLRELDYAEVEGVFRHPERQMIFVGDFIDRGPQQREVLRIARSMCDAGAARAVMGNHEFNAIGWAALDKDGAFLRSHSAKNANQHSKFLVQVEESLSALEPRTWFEFCESLTHDLQASSSAARSNARRPDRALVGTPLLISREMSTVSMGSPHPQLGWHPGADSRDGAQYDLRCRELR